MHQRQLTLQRYANMMNDLMRELAEVTKPGGAIRWNTELGYCEFNFSKI
jgi:hypothetical protein